MLTAIDLAEAVRDALLNGIFSQRDHTRIAMLLARWEAQEATPNAGRGLARLFHADHAGAIKQVTALEPSKQRQLAEAYIGYYVGNGGVRQMGADEVMAAWAERAARIARAAEAQRCAVGD